jgi:hypothetical protein
MPKPITTRLTDSKFLNHATPTTVCAVCAAPQLDGLAFDERTQRWLCGVHDPLPRAKCGCTRENAYSHSPARGFRCRHGEAV